MDYGIVNEEERSRSVYTRPKYLSTPDPDLF
jgi:hypothetical protein